MGTHFTHKRKIQVGKNVDCMDPPAPKKKKKTTRTAVHDSRAPKNNHHNNEPGAGTLLNPPLPSVEEEDRELFSWNVFKKTFPKNPGLFYFQKGIITPQKSSSKDLVGGFNPFEKY